MPDFTYIDRSTIQVGIDTTALAFPPSGIRTYVEALINQFERDDSGVSVILRPPATRWNDRLPARANRVVWDLWDASAAPSTTQLVHVPHGSAPIRQRSPVVVTLHDLIPLTDQHYRHSRGMRLYQDILRRTIPRATAVIVPSRYVASEAQRVLEIPNERLSVVPMAAGHAFRPAGEPGRPETLRELGINHKYIFNVGGFDRRKNLPALLEAFAIFSRESSEQFQLVIAGAPHTDNPYVYPPLVPDVDRLGLGDRVLMPGGVSDRQKIALYQHAMMYVTPSLQEGFGMTVLEAMACGTPVVASNRTSLPEVVGNGGLVVEPDPRTLAGAMLSIAEDANRAAALRAAGLKRAASFSWAETARQTQAVYRRALERTS